MKTPPPYWKVKASPIVREYFDYVYYRPKPLHWEWYALTKGGYLTSDEHFPFSDLPTLTQAQFKKHFYDPWKAGQAFDNMMGNAIEKLNELLPTTTANAHAPQAIGGSNQHIIVTPADGMDAEVWQEGNVIKARSVPKRTRTDSKRITLAKHNRITAEMQRQCEQLQGELAKKQAESDNYRKAYVDESMKVIKVQGKIEELEQRKKDWEHVLNARIAQLEADRDQQHSIIVNKEAYIKRLEDDRQRIGTELHTAETTIEKLHRSHLNELNEITKERDFAVYIAWGLGLCAAILAVAKLIAG